MIVESFFIESEEGIFFDVKGLYHPDDKIVAYARYFPEDLLPERFVSGIQRRKHRYNGISYVKYYNLHQRYEIIEQMYPDYNFRDPRCNETLLQGIPESKIKEIYNPLSFSNYNQDMKIKRFTEEIKDLTGLVVGITGSTLIGLDNPFSDIDAVFMGNKDDCEKFHVFLVNNIADSPILSVYSRNELLGLYKNRQQDIPLESTISEELRKVNQGNMVFGGEKIDFYIRLVNTEDLLFHNYHYRSLGTRIFSGTIVDSSRGISTPSVYLINLETRSALARELKESQIFIYSLRGRHAFNLQPGTRISGQGILEKMTLSSPDSLNYRLLIDGFEQGRFDILGT